MKTLRILSSFQIVLALCVTLLTANALLAGNVLYVPRSIDTDTSSNNWNNGTEQRGGLAVSLEYSPTGNYTIGFWMRHVSENEALSGDVSGTGYILSVTDFSRDDQQAFSESLLPTDDEWHYFMLTIDSTGNQSLYMDGALVASVTYNSGGGFNNGCRLEAIAFGASTVNDSASLKGPTELNFELDDVTIWDAISTEVTEIHEEIYRYGSKPLDDGIYNSHANLLIHYNFENSANSMTYKEDDIYGTGIPNIGTGYSTQNGTPIFNQDTGKPSLAVVITVETEYGASNVSPTVAESGDFVFGSSQVFEAPAFVYLDRFGNELGSSLDDTTTFIDQAFYRAKNVGYAVDGSNIQGTDRFFTVNSLEEDISIIWQWELEYAVIVEYEAGNVNISPADGNPLVSGVPVASQSSIGKKWVSADTIISAEVDSSVLIGDTRDTRFSAEGYRLENFPRSSGEADQNNFITFDGKDGYLLSEDTGIDLTDTDFTIEFMARRIPIASTDTEFIMSIGSNSSTNQQLRIGYNNSNNDHEFIVSNSSATYSIDVRFTDEDWHHWAVVFDESETTLYLYRDGVLISEGNFSLNYGGDDDIAIGARNVLGVDSRHFSGNVDNFRIWNTMLDADAIETAMNTQSVGSAADLELELTFDDDYTFSSGNTDVTSSENIIFTYQNFEAMFPTGVDYQVMTDAVITEFETTELEGVGSRVSVDEFTIRDWIRIVYTWDKEYLLQIDVTDDQGGLNLFDAMPYISGDFSLDGSGDVWVSEGSAITAGVQYRTDGRCYTLDGFTGNSGLFATYTYDDLADGSYDGAVTRELTLTAVNEPGTLVWVFSKTIFRAFITLGESLDVSSTAALNTQLIPDLCVEGELHLTNGKPQTIFANLDLTAIQNGGTPGNLNQELQWDAVGQRLIPVMPGEYQVEWQDANDPSLTHLIHIATDLPQETTEISWEREDETGLRLIDSDAYVTDFTFGDLDDRFPASPLAHYNHIYSADADQRPPLQLDPNSSDNWHYHGFGFSTGTIYAQDGESSFVAASAGRTVLLYSYRPDSTEVATGDAAQEAFAVRLVESASIESVTHADDILGSQNRRSFYTSEELPYYLVQDVDSMGLSVGADHGRSFGFWAKLDGTVSDEQLDRVVFDLDNTVTQNVLRIGFRGAMHATAPGALYVECFNDGTNTELFAINADTIAADDSWHFWTIIHDNGTNEFRFYVDGMHYDTISVTIPYLASSDTEMTIGRDVEQNALSLNGALDHISIITDVIDTDDVRALMLNNYIGPYEVALDFDADLDTDRFVSEGTMTLNFSVYEQLADSVVQKSAALEGFTQTYDGFSEVATRVRSKLDTAGFDSGYLINELSNYNPSIYNRSETVGLWGPIYPVNWGGLYTASNRSLKVVYYQNPFYLQDADALDVHPNVAWPYSVVQYDAVEFPTSGAHKDKRIYVASRLGTEGVDANGVDQLVFDPVVYENVSLYNQPDPTEIGYNPNEEHALIAPSIKDQLTGDTVYSLSQDAAFALQNALNSTDESSVSTYTSEPWVLVQYDNLESGESEMAAYKVEKTRVGVGAVFPVLDSETNEVTDALGQPVEQPIDPSYDFSYATYAGDIHIPPYPLNRVVGSVIVDESWGGNIGLQRALWHDINGNAWTVSGDGEYFYKYWYPFRSDFWYEDPSNGLDGQNDISVGTRMVWLPTDDETFFEDGNTATDEDLEPGQPATVVWTSYWKDGYPVLKRGESMTYTGGEFFNENSGAEGLPGIVGFAAAQIIYDSANPFMLYNEFTDELYSARVVRALDRIEVDFEQGDLPDELTPAYTDNIMVDAERYHFKQLVGSLQKRLYFDSLRSKLVFRGRLNDLESGDPDLTSTPVSLSVLEPNIMTQLEYESILTMLTDLGIGTGDTTFDDAVQSIYEASQNPHGLTFTNADNEVDATEQKFYAGLEPLGAGSEQPRYFSYTANTDTLTEEPESDRVDLLNALILLFSGHAGDISVDDLSATSYQHIQSLGTGSVIIPNANLLTAKPTDTDYITVVENNHVDAGGAISLHIIQIGDERYRGAIKVIEAADVFSEKINIKHTGDFGGNSEDIFYQWWVRNVDNLDNVGLPAELSDSEDYDPEWQLYTQGLGQTTIAFAGRPDITLADKLFYVRYGHGDEFNDVTGESNVVTNDPDAASASDGSWRLVDINDANDDYVRSGSDDLTDGTGDAVPFQWAGASNSPQIQSDGSYDFIPQLVMGWVKRVLDRVNPYEARFSDFYNNESPATYSSQLQIAGGPYVGNVALNSDKDVIENVGLIALYETVLDRAKSLTLEIVGASDSGTNQAVLLAATRLAFLYELLAREAYTDAQNPTIAVTTDNGLDTVSSYVHAFYNQQATLLDEELALLRGTDFVVAYPAYNRMFWNYVKGEGEAAYNATYNIYDENTDGFINEYDAAALYPQGHGDAWGHFLSSNSMHYELLQHTAFDWEAKAELYSLLDNVIEADYLDEGSFARIAAAKARAGLEIVRATYRSAYTADPDGQWQGYTDSDTSRAWGVSEWAKRTGQAALFDWAIGNAILPASVDADAENLDRLDRKASEAEIREISGALVATQLEMDRVNKGFNPIGFDTDSMVFDIDPQLLDGGAGLERVTHFEQVYAKAIVAAQNAETALAFASKLENQIRKTAEDTDALRRDALFQDMDYRNRLIEIFGSPYDGTIGPGEIYAEGYEGPDTLLYLYLDQIDIDDYVPAENDRIETLKTSTLPDLASSNSNLTFDVDFLYKGSDDTITDVFDQFYLTEDFESTSVDVDVPVGTIADYAFQADDDWGARVSTGDIQTVLQEYIHGEIALEKSISEYTVLLNQMDVSYERMKSLIDVQSVRQSARDDSYDYALIAAGVSTVGQILKSVFQYGAYMTRETAYGIREGFPRMVGMSNDLTSVARGTVLLTNTSLQAKLRYGETFAGTLPQEGGAIALGVIYASLERQLELSDELIDIKNLSAELSMLMSQEASHRYEIGLQVAHQQSIESRITTTIAEGFRLMDEREAYNISLASMAQSNRYNDMMYRLVRNDALRKYQDAYHHALRYAWLTAKAYDYETSLSSGQSAAATTLLEDLVKVRTLGLWENGEPQIGQGGLAEVLAQLKANFDTLEGQLGINNPQMETGKLSLRQELARIRDDNTDSDTNWMRRLQAWRVEDLWDLDEYRLLCRPIADPDAGAQPGIVIDFSSEINEGVNFFGQQLGAGDQAYSLSNYATKIRSVGVWLEGYNDAALATAPRVYLVPVGSDVLRLADSDLPEKRSWNVVEQRIPTPYSINESNLTDLGFIPSVDSMNGSFADLKRFADFRAYHDSGGAGIDSGEMVSDSRLVGRSVWNTRWLLIIPGAYMHADSEHGLDEFIDHVSDIKLVFETYSHAGQ